MKTIIVVLLLISTASAQKVENLILTMYTGDGLTPETAFRPMITTRHTISFEDITSVEFADSVGMVVIRAEYDNAIAAAVAADTTGIVLSRNPAQNNRVQFNNFLLRKKNGIRLRDAIVGRPNVNVDDIILELKRIDREKRPRPRR